MPERRSIVEIHRDGAWHQAAELIELGSDRCRFDYLSEYVFGGSDPWPVAHGLPLGLAPDRFVVGPTGTEADRTPPAFIYDLVPQGKGRRYLLDRLSLADSDNLVLPLVLAGSFNPIGCVRLSTAVEFFAAEAVANPDAATTQGFSLADVLERSQGFLDHLSLHAMLASGTTGVQGVAPKFLLTTDLDGRWFADMAVPDERAVEHWLIKLPRAKADDDRAVLRNEAAYLRLAQRCGLRTVAEPKLHGEMLFVRRFDRQVVNGKLHRLHQESLASICGLKGFGQVRSQQTLLAGLRDAVRDPLTETVEFIKRDVLNQAMRNTDNHARNTAVQRLVDGTVQLTPVFDFAPMFLDSEVIARGCHWRGHDGKVQQTWLEVIETLDVDDDDRGAIARELVAFAGEVASIPEVAIECGVEQRVLELCLQTIERQVDQLGALAALAAPKLDSNSDSSSAHCG